MSDILNMALGLIVIAVGFASFLAYPGLQYWAVRRLRGAWLILGTVPLAFMAIVLAYTAVSLFQGSNLWPLLLIFTAPLATVYLLLLRLAVRFLGPTQVKP